MRTMPRAQRAPSLLRPLPMLAVAVLLLNDHILKGSGLLPGWLTGKLSDVAGLFFFPVLLAIVLARFTRLSPRALAWVAALLTASVFAAVKVVPEVNAVVSRAWGPMVLDPSDLLALPFALLSALWMQRARKAVPEVTGERFAFVLAAVASMATTPAYRPCLGPGAPPLRRVNWDVTCAQPAPVLAHVDGRHVTLTFQPVPADDACEMPLGLHLAIRTREAYAEVEAMNVTDTRIGEALKLEVDLPFEASCGSLHGEARTRLPLKAAEGPQD